MKKTRESMLTSKIKRQMFNCILDNLEKKYEIVVS